MARGGLILQVSPRIVAIPPSWRVLCASFSTQGLILVILLGIFVFLCRVVSPYRIRSFRRAKQRVLHEVIFGHHLLGRRRRVNFRMHGRTFLLMFCKRYLRIFSSCRGKGDTSSFATFARLLQCISFYCQNVFRWFGFTHFFCTLFGVARFLVFSGQTYHSPRVAERIVRFVASITQANNLCSPRWRSDTNTPSFGP